MPALMRVLQASSNTLVSLVIIAIEVITGRIRLFAMFAGREVKIRPGPELRSVSYLMGQGVMLQNFQEIMFVRD